MNFSSELNEQNQFTSDINMSEQIENNRADKADRIDRSSYKYSVDKFCSLPREEQGKLLEKYLIDTPAAEYDSDKIFQFSRSKLSSIRDELGFKNGIIDVNPVKGKKDSSDSVKGKTFYIDHGKRGATKTSKFTLTTETSNKLDKLLEGLSNIEKSKAVDAILSSFLDSLLEEKAQGCFHVAYRPTEKEILI